MPLRVPSVEVLRTLVEIERIGIDRVVDRKPLAKIRVIRRGVIAVIDVVRYSRSRWTRKDSVERQRVRSVPSRDAVDGKSGEPELLKYVSSIVAHSPNIVGHNVAWDLRFLWQRFVVNGIAPPNWLRVAVKAKPWDISDTMTMWNPDRDKRISLDRLCRILGVPTSKGDMDGSKVWDAYRAGEIDRIAAYCRADVEAVRECYRRMTA